MTLVKIDRGDGEHVLVTAEDALALRDDIFLYGVRFIKATDEPGVYERVDPRDVGLA